MAIELPRFEIPRINTHDLTSNVELPHIDTANVELPKVELPKVDLPRFDLPAIGRRIDGIANDLRSLRIVREPSPAEARTRAASTAGIWLLGGLGLGMAFMYFLDPRAGRARRERLAARIGDLTGMAQRAITGPSRDIGEQARDIDFALEREAAPTTQTVAAGSAAYGAGAGDGTNAESDTTEPRMPELATTQGS